MAESDVKMADWTCSSPTGCAGISASGFLLGEGSLSCSRLVDVSAALGPLRMPSNIGNRKRLLTKQCSHPGHGVLILVQTFLPVSSSAALDDGNEGSEGVDNEDIEQEAVVVVGVVCN